LHVEGEESLLPGMRGENLAALYRMAIMRAKFTRDFSLSMSLKITGDLFQLLRNIFVRAGHPNIQIMWLH
jgi:hypothetical protein